MIVRVVAADIPQVMCLVQFVLRMSLMCCDVVLQDSMHYRGLRGDK